MPDTLTAHKMRLKGGCDETLAPVASKIRNFFANFAVGNKTRSESTGWQCHPLQVMIWIIFAAPAAFITKKANKILRNQ